MSETNGFEQNLVAKRDLLKRYACSITRSSRDVEDLIQDTIAIALIRKDHFTPGTNFNAWLFTIMKMSHSNHIGRDITRQKYQNEFHGLNEAELPMQDEYLSYMDVRRLMAQLPKEQSVALLLIGMEEWSYKEAADYLECSIGTVKSRVSRARAEITRLLEERPSAHHNRQELKQGL